MFTRFSDSMMPTGMVVLNTKSLLLHSRAKPHLRAHSPHVSLLNLFRKDQKGPAEDPRALMQLFRDKVKARGARGMVGLQRIFKIMDDDGSKTLSYPEFSKAVRDFKVGISEENIPILFDAFDSNHDGTINYDEFLRSIRGDLNDFRKGLVEKAFRKIDKDGSGYLEISDIKDTYNASKHPDVMAVRNLRIKFSWSFWKPLRLIITL